VYGSGFLRQQQPRHRLDPDLERNCYFLFSFFCKHKFLPFICGLIFYHMSYYRNGDFSDLEVVVKGSEAIKFKCHQFIVSARSPVMAAMLKHPMQVRISPIFLRDYFLSNSATIFFYFITLFFFYTVLKQYLEARKVPYKHKPFLTFTVKRTKLD